MNMSQFLNFAKGAGLVGKGSTISDFDRLFMRAVRTVPSGRKLAMAPVPASADGAEAAPLHVPPLAPAADKPRVGKESWAKLKMLTSVTHGLSQATDQKKGSHLAMQHHFVGALVRLARLKYGGGRTSLADNLSKLCTVRCFTARAMWGEIVVGRMRILHHTAPPDPESVWRISGGSVAAACIGGACVGGACAGCACVGCGSGSAATS